MHHPWRELRDHWPDWAVVFADMAVAGLTCWRSKTITLDRGLLQAERRSTLAHELEHVRRGPVPGNRFFAAREETLVEREAARRMIDIRDLGEALAWAHDLHEAADELWVDVELLRARLDGLHPSERAYLRRRLPDH